MRKRVSALLLAVLMAFCLFPAECYAEDGGKWYFTLRGDANDEVGSTHQFPMSDYNGDIFISHVSIKKGKLIIDKYIYETSDPTDMKGIYTEYKLKKKKKTKYKIAKHCKFYRCTTETGNPKDSKLEKINVSDLKEQFDMNMYAYQGISFKIKNNKVVKLYAE